MVFFFTFFSKLTVFNYGFYPISDRVKTYSKSQRAKEPKSQALGLELYNQVLSLFEEKINSQTLVCEVSCGVGGGLAFIRDQTNVNILGLDSSKMALVKAKLKFKIPTKICFAPDLPLQENCIDIFINVEASHNYFGDKFASELYRCLKPGGLVIMTDDTKKDFSEKEFELRKILETAGFRITFFKNIVENVINSCLEDSKRREKYSRFFFGDLRKHILSFSGCRGTTGLNKFINNSKGYFLLRAEK